LLKDLENQVTITQDLVARGASASTLNNSLNVLKSIHQQMIDTFSQSSGAQTAVYKLFGDKMRMHDILTYSKNVIYNLAAIINQR
jgi:hypothetical protein